MYLFFIIVAFILDSPIEILQGLKKITSSPDILISDYVEIGGIGAALINSALTSLLSLLLLVFSGVKPNGATIMSLWLITGFSFFGKNIINIWPIIAGVYLYSRYQKEPFLNYSLVALLSTTLAPTVSQLSFTNYFPTTLSIILGYLIGILTGFILAPISSHCLKSHNGYNLYNVGFAAGIFATLLMSIFRALGIEFETRLLWNTESNYIFSILLLIISFYLVAIGLYNNPTLKEDFFALIKHPGRLVSDFYILFGNTCYFNMGILCLLSTILVLALNSNLNGPTIAGIFTIVGFGAFGKHIKNITPIIIGAILGALFHINPVNSPSLILSILFSTALAPIAGKFGYKVGILAGFLHVNMVTNIGYLHGGLNLYNNGLAAGFVAMILIPIINIFEKEPI
ncbi:DUF1576 domain-containing protein [Clostridium sp. AL.422]|uniref:DUF1576 domain-containing protein n=1 Tax=Clostridium TaxID=1485 RepID=UPI00293DF998|nr:MULTISPECIES: DUF1576 domain-containing protein [unclassified Clostridium]MDV4151492.1 DUF1576 domain-containing protein [Clostridium sp. AL.422]